MNVLSCEHIVFAAKVKTEVQEDGGSGVMVL